MKTEEEGVSPPRLYRWLPQVWCYILQTHSAPVLNIAKSLSDCPSLSVTVFTEALPSDSGDNIASQSVPMVTASTGMSSAVDDGDEVFMEQEGEG